VLSGVRQCDAVTLFKRIEPCETVVRCVRQASPRPFDRPSSPPPTTLAGPRDELLSSPSSSSDARVASQRPSTDRAAACSRLDRRTSPVRLDSLWALPTAEPSSLDVRVDSLRPPAGRSFACLPDSMPACLPQTSAHDLRRSTGDTCLSGGSLPASQPAS
jgi:hypothetical protein